MRPAQRRVGQHVEVALFDVALGMTGFYGMAHLMTGENFSRQGNSPNGSPSVGLYDAADAPFQASDNTQLFQPAQDAGCASGGAADCGVVTERCGW